MAISWAIAFLLLTVVSSQQCVDCQDSVVTSTCPRPDLCGFKPACRDCMAAMPMPQCPNATLCPGCVDCVDGAVNPSCPRPDKCGYAPACGDCMSGMAMPNCPDPEVCISTQTDCIMSSYFVASQHVCVLFKTWNVTSAGQYFATVLAILILGCFREWIGVYRIIRDRHSKPQPSLEIAPVEKHDASTLDDLKLVPDTLKLVTKHVSGSGPQVSFKQEFCTSLWYLLNMTCAYLLMLIFMTYNTGLCIAVLMGCWFGNLLCTYFYKSKYGASFTPPQGDHCYEQSSV